MLALRPGSAPVQLWLERFDEFRRAHRGLPGLLEVAARIHLLAGSPQALGLADQWVAAAGGDPAARLCRMEVRLIEGQLAAARDDAIAAVQGAIEPDAALRDVVALLGRSAQQAAPGVAEGLKLMRQQFLELQQAGLPTFGGR